MSVMRSKCSKMISGNSYLTVCLLSIFYLFSQTGALPASYTRRNSCKPSQLRSAVECGCLVYRPLYEQYPLWNGLENICEDVLAGFSTNEYSTLCYDAPFPFLSVESESLSEIDGYFNHVKGHCEEVQRAERRIKKAERRVRARRRVDQKLNRQAAFESRMTKLRKEKDMAEASARPRNEFRSEHHTSFSLAFSTGSSSILTATRAKSERGRTKIIAYRHSNREMQARMQRNLSTSNTLRADSPFKMLPPIHIRQEKIHQKLGDFCVVVADLKNLSGEDALRVCCPDLFQ